jgi:MatE protein
MQVERGPPNRIVHVIWMSDSIFNHDADSGVKTVSGFRHFVALNAMPAETQIDSSTSASMSDFRMTLRLALPLIVAELGWMSMGLVDTIMVGRLPDSAISIGATGLGQSLYHMVAIFGGGLLLGMDTFVAQAYGRKDEQDARHTLVNGMVLGPGADSAADAGGFILAGDDAAIWN